MFLPWLWCWAIWVTFFPFICSATEIDASQALPPPRLQHITLILLCITTFNALAGHPNTMSSGKRRRTQKVLHLYNCILLKKKKKKSNCCLLAGTVEGKLAMDILVWIIYIASITTHCLEMLGRLWQILPARNILRGIKNILSLHQQTVPVSTASTSI